MTQFLANTALVATGHLTQSPSHQPTQLSQGTALRLFLPKRPPCAPWIAPLPSHSARQSLAKHLESSLFCTNNPQVGSLPLTYKSWSTHIFPSLPPAPEYQPASFFTWVPAAVPSEISPWNSVLLFQSILHQRDSNQPPQPPSPARLKSPLSGSHHSWAREALPSVQPHPGLSAPHAQSSSLAGPLPPPQSHCFLPAAGTLHILFPPPAHLLELCPNANYFWQTSLTASHLSRLGQGSWSLSPTKARTRYKFHSPHCSQSLHMAT